MIENKIILITGLQGVGKTRLGSYLKNHYGYVWYDLDQKILQKFAIKSIRSFFYLVGEEEFRKKEKEVFLELISERKEKGFCFISLGGGSTHILEEYRYPSLYLFESQKHFCKRIRDQYRGKLITKIPGWIQARYQSSFSIFIQNKEEEIKVEQILMDIWDERHAVFSKASSHIFPVEKMSFQFIAEAIIKAQI